jgi:hypothetical protein
LQFLQNVIEASFINWRILPLVKINTSISDTPWMCVCIYRKKCLQHSFVNVLIVILSKYLINFFYIIELHININKTKLE